MMQEREGGADGGKRPGVCVLGEDPGGTHRGAVPAQEGGQGRED